MNDKQNTKSRPRVVWKDGKCIICPPENGRLQNNIRVPVSKTAADFRTGERKATERTAAPSKSDSSDFFGTLKSNIVAVVLIFALISILIAAASAIVGPKDIDLPSDVQQDTGNNTEVVTEQLPLYIDTPAPAVSTSLAVCIDPGHGFDDVGTSNAELGVYEHEVVLAVGLKLRDKLEAAGIKVYMTHDTNEPPPDAAEPYLFGMKKRNGMANSLSDVGLYISIHCDAFYEDTTVWGPRVYYMSDDKGGEGLALEIEKELGELNPGKEVQVKAMSGMNSYQVIRESDMPAVLVETGFLSNLAEAEAMLTETWQDSVANALADAIITACKNNILS